MAPHHDGRGGMFAWNDSVRELIGREFDLKTGTNRWDDGLSDCSADVRDARRARGARPDRTNGARRYEELLPASLPRKNGYVCPNVREILEHLRDRGDVRSYLLTGNTRGGARAKLTYYGLMEFFPDGAFAEDAGDRSSIAAPRSGVGGRAGPVAEHGVFVVGDTPHDMPARPRSARAPMAVATGGYTLEELHLIVRGGCSRSCRRPRTSWR